MKPAIYILGLIAALAIGSLGTAMALAYRAGLPIPCSVNCTEINMKLMPVDVD